MPYTAHQGYGSALAGIERSATDNSASTSSTQRAMRAFLLFPPQCKRLPRVTSSHLTGQSSRKGTVMTIAPPFGLKLNGTMGECLPTVTPLYLGRVNLQPTHRLIRNGSGGGVRCRARQTPNSNTLPAIVVNTGSCSSNGHLSQRHPGSPASSQARRSSIR